jgi:hypothetical protein
MLMPLSIYLCSDRDDSAAEREYLHASVFPDLVARAAARGLELRLVDPHRDDRTLVQALELLDTSPAHVVALVGTRYGPKLDFFDLPFERLPEAFRQTAIDGASRFHIELALAILFDEKLSKVSNVFVRVPEQGAPPAAPEIEPLLDRLRKTGAAIASYPCRWEEAAGRFDEFAALGRAVADRIGGWIAEAAGDVTKSTQIQVTPLPRLPAPAPDIEDLPPAPSAALAAPAPASVGEFPPWAKEALSDRLKDVLRSSSQPLYRRGPQPMPAAMPDPAPAEVDENVQFTVYRPKAVPPETWSDLLAFAHLSEKPPDAAPDEPDPVEEVKRQAKRILGDQAPAYQSSTQDSLHAVPKRGEITFLPEAKGLEFNPPRRTFVWRESVHREEFRFKADRALDGQTARGKLSIFHGAILLGDVPLAIKVDSTPAPPKIRSLLDTGEATELEPVGATRYRKIFASYSHKDLAIVEQFEAFAEAMGDEYLRDWKHLRAGERWQDKLKKMIREADVFQLFWSRHSMVSPFVRQEWEYALGLTEKGESFVRPTYWEDPMPTSVKPELPPPDLAELHFQRLSVPVGKTGQQGAESGPPHGGPMTEPDLDLLSGSAAAPVAQSDSGTEFELALDDEPAVDKPADMYAAATESDFQIPESLDSDLADASGSEVVALEDADIEDDAPTFDESSETMTVGSASSPSMGSVDLSPSKGVMARRASYEDDDDDFVPREKPIMAARASGSSEALKIILGVLVLCAALFGLLVILTGRIPFVK